MSSTTGHPALSTFASSAGCACKIGQFDLTALLARVPSPTNENLLVGPATSDDAAVYRLSGGQVLVQTVDFFTPIVDDPYLYGQIAATNALSDLYAMRARPVMALALAAFPMARLPGEMLAEILRGGAEKVAESGAVLGGGHSIDHDIPLYGLAASGLAEESRVTRNGGARPGDALVLTKPLGVGIVVRAGRTDTAEKDVAARERLLSDDELEEAVRTMTFLNGAAMEAMEGFSIHAVTDVTGFGLLGHGFEMMENSGTTAELSVEALPLLSAARRLAARGIAPGGSRRNLRSMMSRLESSDGVSEEDLILMADAQTSGGLLVALPGEEAERYVAACRARRTPAAQIVGRVIPRAGRALRVVR
ncbi:MAG TPA: selenide, water dikinase SelD [Thermoanaerobaculia bacterium]